MSITVRSSKELYDEWTAAASLEEDNAATTDNPSGDGLSNLIKYTLGLDPTVPVSENPILTEEVVVEDETYLQVRFTRDPDAAVLIEGLSANALDNPEAWSTTTTATEYDEQTGATTVRDTVPVAPGSPRFLKVRFSLP